jgi:ABC-type lipoprotein export system ATPase subunit
MIEVTKLTKRYSSKDCKPRSASLQPLWRAPAVRSVERVNTNTLDTSTTGTSRTETAVRLVDVHKTYAGATPVAALRGVSLDFARGSLTAVMGQSGSGKSTLLNVAAGLDVPTRGQVVIGGTDTSSFSPDDLTRFRRDQVGFIFQSYNLIGHLDVLTNIELPLVLGGRTADRAWLAELVRTLGIAGLEDRLPGELSGGQAQRVAIARALMTRPAVVFATSRPVPSTPAAVSRCWSCSATPPAGSARPSSSSPTTASWRPRPNASSSCPTGSSSTTSLPRRPSRSPRACSPWVGERMWSLALAGARAHRTSLSGTALVLATAGALVSLVGVLFESGSRAGAGVEGGSLVALASSYSGIALVVVVMVVASMVTLALRARRREFALMRTIGATRRQVRQQVSLEVLLVALIAVPLGAAPGIFLARLLEPLLQDAGMLSPGSQLSLSPLPVLAAVALLVPTALLAGRLAARETLRTPPTDAVRSSAVETPGIGWNRRAFALVTWWPAWPSRSRRSWCRGPSAVNSWPLGVLPDRRGRAGPDRCWSPGPSAGPSCSPGRGPGPRPGSPCTTSVASRVA